MRLIIGMSGASGLIYGIRLLQVLKDEVDVETHLVMSQSAKLNVSIETDWQIVDVEALANEVHHINNIAANISSGSFRTEGMIVVPCSMKTLSGIANSYADTLIVRAADVVLKEFRRLVIVPRETPLHVGHCKLLYEAAQLGAVIVPPMPAFYHRPKTIDDLINQTVNRVLDLLDIDLPADLFKRWSGGKGSLVP